MQNMLSIKTKWGEVQIKIHISEYGLVRIKSKLIEPDGYEYRYEDFDFFTESYLNTFSEPVKIYFGNKIWFTMIRGEAIENFIQKNVDNYLQNRVARL